MPKKQNKLISILFLSLFIQCASAQVIVNSETNMTLFVNDTSWVNAKSPKSLLKLNYQTGETNLKVGVETFKTADTALSKQLSQSKMELDLHFNVSRETLNLLTKDNKVYTFEVPGMLYLNGHFHSVQVMYSFYNKNGNIADLANNKIFASVRCYFSAENYQIDWMKAYGAEPIQLWLSKQPINFFNVE